MSQPRQNPTPTPEPKPDSPPERESAPLAEPLFSGGSTVTPETTSQPSIKNK